MHATQIAEARSGKALVPESAQIHPGHFLLKEFSVTRLCPEL